ncbi:MAG TPA: hypothetical protein VLK65_02355 [Vicinamibacteria bacterium]|nr:hypothetical protein [Vicinamibacteria bacterium]
MSLLQARVVSALACSCTSFLVWGLSNAPVQGSGAGREEVVLFTEGEAGELRIEENKWDPVPRARSAQLGPVIVVRSPEVKRVEGSDIIEAHSPTDLEVHFQENQAPIDMSSLQISAKKGPFSKSLTDRLRPFVRGTTLAVDKVDVPSGKFQIEIVIKDDQGQETAETYRLIVEK